ncbi:sugar phosphate isomerase/epimerase family protein [Micromonospora sp. WMMD736]|uniref:sugar phosphate isomerase/epimerase family protein n=1 Tax=Micromonospora sp. WMMD736 TaxID=3404112 RepID=UPI003B957367
MISLAAFADEISPTLTEALTALHSRGIDRIDLRSIDYVNVLELDDQRVGEVERLLADEGVAVAAIATPIGKVPVDSAGASERARFERALEVASRLSANFIRVFTGYGPGGRWQCEADRDAWCSAVTDRITEMDAEAGRNGMTVLVENDLGTYAESPHRMFALLKDTASDTVRTAFDAANYALCGFDPYPAFDALRSWIGVLHVKDIDDTGSTTVAGQGCCRWPEILEELAATPDRPYLSLEPHLKFAGPAGGFSGIDGFTDAASALSVLLNEHLTAQKGTLR